LSNSSIETQISDVRKPNERSAEHIENSENFPLDFINQNMAMVSKNMPYILHCQSGYRSTVASSTFKARALKI